MFFKPNLHFTSKSIFALQKKHICTHKVGMFTIDYSHFPQTKITVSTETFSRLSNTVVCDVSLLINTYLVLVSHSGFHRRSHVVNYFPFALQ